MYIIMYIYVINFQTFNLDQAPVALLQSEASPTATQPSMNNLVGLNCLLTPIDIVEIRVREQQQKTNI